MSLEQDNVQGARIAKGNFAPLYYIETVLKWRWTLIVTVLLVGIVSVAVSLLLPKWYKATASILPPQQQEILGMLGMPTSGAGGSLLESIAQNSAIGGLLGKQLGVYNYLAILNSRTALEDVVNKFDLMDEYHIKNRSMDDAIKELRANVDFTVEDEGYLSLVVWDKSPLRAADITNYFIKLLNDISLNLAVNESRNVRNFVGEQLDDSKLALKVAEDTLRDYQERTGMFISGEDQASWGAIAELYAQKAREEIRLAVLRKMVSSDFPTVKQIELELGELDTRLSKVPSIGLESFRLYRNVYIQEKIVEFLYPLYERAKIDEQRNVPVILVLDKAVPPEKKSSPKRALIVIGSVALSLIFMLGLIFIRERVRSTIEGSPEDKASYDRIRFEMGHFFKFKRG